VPIDYDPLISKLTAWAEDRPMAVARMRRALAEYLIGGIKTTVPFFTWLLAQPQFLAGSFHTTFLDEVLAARNGRPFVVPPPALEDVAAIGAALHAVLPPAAAGGGELAGRHWKWDGRAEGLRGGAVAARGAARPSALRRAQRVPSPSTEGPNRATTGSGRPERPVEGRWAGHAER
jgi:hypothetical protein